MDSYDNFYFVNVEF